MKAIITFLLCLISANSLFAQVYTIDLNIQDASTTLCPVDTQQIIFQPTNWSVYQTTDDYWDGTKDTSKCINFELDTTFSYDRYFLKASSLDVNKPVYLRYLFNDANKVLLDTHSLYRIVISSVKSGDFSFDINNNCNNDMCSGLFIGVEIPDSTYTNTTLRWQQYSQNFENIFSIRECLITEKFEESYLREFIIKLSFKTDNPLKSKIYFRESFLNRLSYPTISHLTEIPAEIEYLENDEYNVPIYHFRDNWWTETFLVKHNSTGYPNEDNLYFAEAYPVENPQEKSIINLIVYSYEEIFIQPFTSLRGALVEGNDTLRHEFNLVNNGGTFCSYPAVELIFEDDNSYIHNAGEINFSGNSGCMMFRHGGTLEIGDDTILNYGNTGQGILMIGKNSTIKFGKNSKLVVDNHFKLWETSMWPDEQVYIELKEGNELIFGEYARLSKNTFQENGHMKLNIYMNGGILDDSNLTPEERQLINRIYPEEVVEIPTSMEVVLFPNPTKEDLQIEISSPLEDNFQMAIFSLDGQLLSQQNGLLNTGKNQLELSTSQLTSGMYFLKISSSNGEQFVQKFVKQ